MMAVTWREGGDDGWGDFEEKKQKYPSSKQKQKSSPPPPSSGSDFLTHFTAVSSRISQRREISSQILVSWLFPAHLHRWLRKRKALLLQCQLLCLGLQVGRRVVDLRAWDWGSDFGSAKPQVSCW